MQFLYRNTANGWLFGRIHRAANLWPLPLIRLPHKLSKIVRQSRFGVLAKMVSDVLFASSAHNSIPKTPFTFDPKQPFRIMPPGEGFVGFFVSKVKTF